MKKLRLSILLAGLMLFLLSQVVWAASASNPEIQKIRFSQSAEKIRIVLDVSTIPTYTTSLEPDNLHLDVDFAGTLASGVLPQMTFNDEVVSGLRVVETEPGKLRAIVDLKTAAVYKVFSLTGPNRLVIDIVKGYDQKITQEIAPGVRYTSWSRGSSAGPVAAYILDVNLKAGYRVKPVLSNDAISGLETVKSMADRVQAIAAVNGSYFDPDGEILGLLMLDGKIVSVSDLPRTAMGVTAEGNILFDQVDYNGTVTLPGDKLIAISGVNCERGPDNLILYNSFYGSTTGTNEFGAEYVITGDTVTSVNGNNSALTAGSVVLSAHGTAAQVLSGLKVGSKVKISQTLGSVWDKAVYVLGAGPMLVKDGSVYLTTKTEQFGSDVAGGRAPRTALGLDKQGHLLLVVVDGRQSHSIGMTLLELAQFMQELGAVNAMNLDGGGSSDMVVNGKVVNKPSDGRERLVGDSLVILKN
ncbi:MAG: phosphodiester glycosidase family protein [Veillonellales bacterium]